MTAPLEHADPAVQHLLDRVHIADIVDRYAFGVDRRDMDMVASCFAPDVDASAWGMTNRDDLVQFISGVAHFHTTMHHMGNQLIEIDGDTAAADTYAMLTHHADQADGEVYELNLSGNRYCERLRRQADGTWTIVQRGAEPTWGPTGVTGLTTTDPQVQWLVDRAELYDLMMHYALGIDAREYDRIGACFAPTFHAAYGPLEFTDLGELLAFIKGVEHFDSTNHFLGSHLAEVDGDTGRMETFAMITHREQREGAPPEWMAGGSSYVDEVARIDGRWVITERGERAARVATAPPVARRSDDAAVQWLLDRQTIADLVTTSAFAIDRRDWALYEACFASIGSSDVDVARPAAEQWESTCHFLNNQFVEIDGDEASVETYLYRTQKEPGEVFSSSWAHGARRFVDTMRRTADGWRLMDRRVEDNRVSQQQEVAG